SPESYSGAFSRPSGSGARFLGLSGSPDYLPSLPDGDLTLLNTKASRFAVFVRRVATQVFSELRQSGWERLSAGDIMSMQGFSTVRAVISKDGKLLRIEPLESSGSSRFDSVLFEAAKRGAADPHPPAAAAASDGNIHFIFKARSWVRIYSDPRTGARNERRWLLLATGLE
ncbi:MAG: energy transducer TonB, partial [Candidatus Dadabacteria bacterium]